MTKKVTKTSQNVTFDRERAEQDAAKKGLTGQPFEDELQRFTDYWDSAGWRRKNGPVKDRNATWRSWLDQPFRKPDKPRSGVTRQGSYMDQALEELRGSGNFIEGELVR